MSLSASKILGGPMVTNKANITESYTTINSLNKYIPHSGLSVSNQKIEFRRQSYGCALGAKVSFSSKGFWRITRKNSVQCQSTRTHNTESKERNRNSDDLSDVPRPQVGDDKVDDMFDTVLPETPVMPKNTCTYSTQGLAGLFKYVYNDAKYVNERARNDLFLLSRGIMKLNDRACHDVAVLGSGFLKLDARAREDTVKIDHGVKRKAEHLHHIAIVLKDKAQSKLKRAADKHWSDGALEADLRRADLLAKRRAMEDAFMALEFVKNIHDMMINNLYKLPLHRKQGSLSDNDMTSIMLEKNGEMIDFLRGKVSTDRITAIQKAYWSMASALSEADGIDYTDPDELELLVATLIDLDAMDGKSSVSLLAECSISPDVNTRKALANALASAPSMWTLGNAGMGALQRLAEDSNPAIASAASKAIYELKKQWEIEEGDSWRFTMNQTPTEEIDGTESGDSVETD